jgi:hypothetical protein
MEVIVEIGLASFIRLRKLRVEHLNEGDENNEIVYRRFLEQLSENKTISFIKLERIF